MTSFLTKEDVEKFILFAISPRTEKHIYKTKDIIKKYKLSRQNIWNLLQAGMPGIKDNGNWYFDMEEVDEWMKINRPDGVQRKQKLKKRH